MGQQTPTAIIVGVVAAAAVLIIGLLALCQYLTTRPRWLRERILQVCYCAVMRFVFLACGGNSGNDFAVRRWWLQCSVGATWCC